MIMMMVFVMFSIVLLEKQLIKLSRIEIRINKIKK